MKVPLSRRAQLHGTAIGLGRSVTPVFHQCTYRREKSLVRSDWQILCLCLRVSPCSYCEQPNWRISTNSTKPVPITDPHAWGLQRTSFPLPSTSGAWLSLCQSVGSVGVPFFTWAGHMSKPACRGTCSHPRTSMVARAWGGFNNRKGLFSFQNTHGNPESSRAESSSRELSSTSVHFGSRL